MPECALADLGDQRQAGRADDVAQFVAAVQRAVGQLQHIDQQQPQEDGRCDRRSHGLDRARIAGMLRRDRLRDLARLGGFDRPLLRRLQDAFQHCLQLDTCGIEVTGHGVQWNPIPGGFFRRGFFLVEDAFQRLHAIGGRVLFGRRRGNDTGDFGVQRALAAGILTHQALHVGMGAAQSGSQRVDLPGQLFLLRPQRCHRGCDGRLGLGASLATRGVEAPVGGGSIRLGFRQILGQAGDFLSVRAGMHALAQCVGGAIGGHALLVVMHLAAQVGGLFFQQLGRTFDRAVLRGVLFLDIGVDRVVDCGRRDHRIVGDEADFHHVGRSDGRGVQRVLDGDQRPVARPVPDRPIGLIGRDVGFHTEHLTYRRDCALDQAGGTQRPIELGIIEEIAPFRHLLRDVQALQDLGLAGHHRFGGGVLAQDALQFAGLVFAGIVDQRTRGGVEWRDPPQCQIGAQRHQHDRREQGCPALADRQEKPAQILTRQPARPAGR